MASEWVCGTCKTPLRYRESACTTCYPKRSRATLAPYEPKGIKPPELTFRVEDAEPIIRTIFVDYKARALWLGIRATHIVDQHFNRRCLVVAKLIRSYEKPVDGQWLNTVLVNHQMIGSAERWMIPKDRC